MIKLNTEDLSLDMNSLSPGDNRGEFTLSTEEVQWDLDEMTPADESALLSLSIVAREQTLVIAGSLDCRFRVPCARCLRPAIFEVEEEIYRVYSSDPDLEDDVDTEMLSGRDTAVSILDAVREAVILSVPGKPLCTPDCGGLCPVCGCNLNEESCDHTGAG